MLLLLLSRSELCLFGQSPHLTGRPPNKAPVSVPHRPWLGPLFCLLCFKVCNCCSPPLPPWLDCMLLRTSQGSKLLSTGAGIERLMTTLSLPVGKALASFDPALPRGPGEQTQSASSQIASPCSCPGGPRHRRQRRVFPLTLLPCQPLPFGPTS